MSDSWLEMKVLQFLLLAKPTTHYFALVAFYEHLDERIIIIDRWEGSTTFIQKWISTYLPMHDQGTH